MNRILLRYFVLIALIIIVSVEVGSARPLANKDQIALFKKSTTCVVLEGGGISYNVFIKDAVEKFWKITPFEFIDQKEFEKRRYDSKYSFLMLIKEEFEKDPEGISYNFLSLLLGDTTKSLTKMPEFSSIPFSYADNTNADYGYVLPFMIKFIQKHLQVLEKKRFFIQLSGLKYYNKELDFKDKILLLNKDEMAPDADTPEKIKTVYKYNFNLLSTDDIMKEVQNNTNNIIFNYHVGPEKGAVGAGRCFEMIFDRDGNLYYYNSRNITNEKPDGFNLDDFSRIKGK